MRKLTLLLLIIAATVQADDKRDWADMCKLVEDRHGFSCDEIERPAVRRVFTRGTQGGYAGGDIVKISNDLWGLERNSTVIHEMVHYLLSTLGAYPVPGTVFQVCGSEHIAWDVSNTYMITKGKRLGVVEKWWVLYPHCSDPTTERSFWRKG